MNNRSPFIPNIPSGAQGHWGDPNQLFNTNNSLNSSGNQPQIPFTAHQQLPPMSSSQIQYGSNPQVTQQSFSTNEWSQSLPNFGNIPNLNSINSANYNYQLASYAVNNQSRGLSLDHQAFVHFPVNLTPPAAAANVNVAGLQMQMQLAAAMGSNSVNSNSSGRVQQHQQTQQRLNNSTSSYSPPLSSILDQSSYLLNLQQQHQQSQARSMSPYSGSSSSPSPTAPNLNVGQGQGRIFQQQTTPQQQQVSNYGVSSGSSPRMLQQGVSPSASPQPQQFYNNNAGRQSQQTPPAAHSQSNFIPRSSPQQLQQTQQQQQLPSSQFSHQLPQSQLRQQGLPSSVTSMAMTSMPSSLQSQLPTYHHQLPTINSSHLLQNQSQQRQQPEPLPPKEKKPRAPRKKKEPPKKPIPLQVNPPAPYPGASQSLNYLTSLSMPDLNNPKPLPFAPAPMRQSLPPRPAPTPRASVIQSQVPSNLNTNSNYQPRTQQPMGTQLISPLPRLTTLSTLTPAMAAVNSTYGLNSKYSVLDYALEKAGIPTTTPTKATSPTPPVEEEFNLDAELTKFYGPAITNSTPVLKVVVTTTAATPTTTAISSVTTTAAVTVSTTTTTSMRTSPAWNTSTTSSSQKVSVTTTTSTTSSTSGAGMTPSKKAMQQVQSQVQVQKTPVNNVKNNNSKKPTKPSYSSDDDFEVVYVKIDKSKARTRQLQRPQTQGQKGRAPIAAPTSSRSTPARSQYTNGRVVPNSKASVQTPAKSSPKTTARKSTAPIPKPKQEIKGKNSQAVEQEPKLGSLVLPPRRAATRKVKQEDLYSDDDNDEDYEPAPKVTRRQTRAMQAHVAKKETPSTTVTEQPPIKMKVNLKEGTATVKPSITERVVAVVLTRPETRRPGPRSKTKVELPDIVPKGDDDLSIVDEFLADSDNTYDPEGSRDEASSDSEEDVIPDYAEEDYDKPRSRPRPGPKCRKLKSRSSKSKSKSPEKKLPPAKSADSSEPEPSLQEAIASVFSPPESPFANDEAPPSPPFKNLTKEFLEPKLQSDENPAPQAPKEPTPASKIQMELDEENLDFEEESTPEIAPIPPPPKPSIIVKGTKEEATKAVDSMRSALAALSSFNIKLSFGKK